MRKGKKEEQLLLFADNGNVTPCPYREGCFTYGIGCKGQSYWCKSHERQEKPK